MGPDRHPMEGEGEARRRLPIDFFELEFLSNKRDARMRDRELPEIEVESKPDELPIDFFELEFLSNKPDPRLRNRDIADAETE